MIDSTKLLSRGSSKRSPFSSKTVANIGVIREDTKKIDSILKERLVLSKVRYGIIKQQEERQRRKKREHVLEKDKDSKNYDIERPESKKRKGFGGFLSGIFRVVMSLLGGIVVKFLPQLITIASTIKKIAAPFAKIVGAVFTFFSLLTGGKLFKNLTKNSKNFNNSKIAKSFSTLDGKFNQLVAAITTFAIVSIGSKYVGDFLKKRSFLKRSEAVKLEKEAEIRRKTDVPSRMNVGRKTDIVEITEDGTTKRIRRETYERKIKKQYQQTELLNISKKSAGERFLRREKKIAFPIDTDLAIERTLPDGRQLVTLGKSNVALEEAVVDGRTVLTAKKSRELKKVLAQELKVSPKSISLNATDIDAEKIILNAQLDKKAKAAAGEDMLLDEIFSKKRLQTDAIKEKKLLANEELLKITKPKPGEAGRSAILLKKLKPNFTGTLLKPGQKIQKGLRGLLTSIGGIPLVKATRKILSNTVGRIPFLGDLIGLLLDIFVFGEPVGRAAFMAIGGILGGFLGAAVGSLIPGPGTLIGGILGGLGGDIVGGLLYDLIFGRKPKITPESAVTKGTVRGVTKTVKGFNEGGLVPRFQPSKLRVDNPMDKSTNLRSLAFYDRPQTGKERMIPIPIPIPQGSTDQQGQMIVVNNSGKQKTNNFSQLYRRG